jgi:hypothetical protein
MSPSGVATVSEQDDNGQVTRVVLVLPFGAPGNVRVEVYSPDGDDNIRMDSELAPDTIPNGCWWGQDNLVAGSHAMVERAALIAWPSLRDFRWQHNICKAVYPEAVALLDELNAAEEALRVVHKKYSDLMGVRAVNVR